MVLKPTNAKLKDTGAFIAAKVASEEIVVEGSRLAALFSLE